SPEPSASPATSTLSLHDALPILRANRKPAGCEACHSTDSWKDLQRFDHAKTSFPLLGAHRATACIDCHKPPNMETKLIDADFKRSEEHTSELQSHLNLVCRLLLE